MSLNAISYVIRETFLSLRRNGWMGVASVVTVAISLIILGFAVTVVYNTSKVTSNIESNIEISAFLTSQPQRLTPDQVQSLETQIEQMPEVQSVALVTGQEALKQFQTSLNSKIIDDLNGKNVLPDKLTIKAKQPEQVQALADKLSTLKGIDKVNYGQGVVEPILKFSHWARWVGISVIALLAIASIVLISITIRLTVFARRREIQIMKFVGATDWFIRWPFLLEGLILGLGGALVGGAIVVYGYLNMVNYVQTSLSFIPVAKDMHFVWLLSVMLLATGAIIGSTGSMISLRKFLRV